MLHNKQNHWQAISKTYSTKNRWLYFAQLYSVPEAYSGPCWTSKINCFVKIVNAWKSLIICAKCSFLDFWQGYEYNSELDTIAFTLNLDFKNCNNGTAWKVSKYEVISGPHFPAFGLNTEIYGVNSSNAGNSVRIQGNTDRKQLCIWTLFTQCDQTSFYFPRIRIKKSSGIVDGKLLKYIYQYSHNSTNSHINCKK